MRVLAFLQLFKAASMYSVSPLAFSNEFDTNMNDDFNLKKSLVYIKVFQRFKHVK